MNDDYPPSGVKAEVFEMRTGDGFYVFWESRQAFGSQGMNMTKENAEKLAEKIRTGEARP